MANLIYVANTSLDGYTEDRDGKFDWTEPSEEYFRFITNLVRATRTHLYGRRMYEAMMVWETDPNLAAESPLRRDFAEVWQAANKIVYSRTLETISTRKTQLEKTFDPEAIRQLKAAGEHDILIGGPGSHVVDKYIENKHQVIVVDDLSTGRLSNLNPLAKFYKLNINDPEIRRVFIDEKPQVINHHAAQIDVRRSVADPKFDAEVNILGSLHLLELAREFVVRKFIHISSGGAIYGEPVYLPCDESHPVQPLSPYGASKYSFELYLYIYKTIYNLEYTILRYANVYGPRQDPLGEAGVVAIFTGQMLNNQPVTINGNGEQLRDFIYVGDVAEANFAALHAAYWM